LAHAQAAAVLPSSLLVALQLFRELFQLVFELLRHGRRRLCQVRDDTFEVVFGLLQKGKCQRIVFIFKGGLRKFLKRNQVGR
jgi:hypothetical protein